jgi:hypothetical protein
VQAGIIAVEAAPETVLETDGCKLILGIRDEPDRGKRSQYDAKDRKRSADPRTIANKMREGKERDNIFRTN